MIVYDCSSKYNDEYQYNNHVKTLKQIHSIVQEQLRSRNLTSYDECQLKKILQAGQVLLLPQVHTVVSHVLELDLNLFAGVGGVAHIRLCILCCTCIYINRTKGNYSAENDCTEGFTSCTTTYCDMIQIRSLMLEELRT